MKFEKEITVDVTIDYNALNKLLIENGFEIKERYKVNDIYYSQMNINEVDNYLDILNDYILIREIIEEDKKTKMITYKHKEFDDNGNIIKQGKVKCNIEDIEKGCCLFESLKYNKIIEIKDDLIVYANNEDELIVQKVNDKHLYIEIEDKCNYIDKIYNDINEMKYVFEKYKIPIKNNSYFIKKAEVEMIETYGECK